MLCAAFVLQIDAVFWWRKNTVIPRIIILWTRFMLVTVVRENTTTNIGLTIGVENKSRRLKIE